MKNQGQKLTENEGIKTEAGKAGIDRVATDIAANGGEARNIDKQVFKKSKLVEHEKGLVGSRDSETFSGNNKKNSNKTTDDELAIKSRVKKAKTKENNQRGIGNKEGEIITEYNESTSTDEKQNGGNANANQEIVMIHGYKGQNLMIRNEKGSEGNTIEEQGSANIGDENEEMTANDMKKIISNENSKTINQDGQREEGKNKINQSERSISINVETNEADNAGEPKT